MYDLKFVDAACEWSVYQTAALLLEKFIFWFGAAYEQQLESYSPKHTPQSLSNMQFCGNLKSISPVPVTYKSEVIGQDAGMGCAWVCQEEDVVAINYMFSFTMLSFIFTPVCTTTFPDLTFSIYAS